MVLYFEFLSLDITQSITMIFDVSATMTGALDAATMPGNVLAIGSGDDVLVGDAQQPEFPGAASYFDLFESATDVATPINESDTTQLSVTLDEGDPFGTTEFRTSLVTNATRSIPEPSSLFLLGLGGVLIGRRRRR